MCESEEQENSTIEEKKNSLDNDYWAQQLASGEHYSISVLIKTLLRVI